MDGSQGTTGVAGSLIERGPELALLQDRIDTVVADGVGQLVLIAGEAGVGKTSLVREALDGRSVRTLIGGCDPLFTPRPLGPLLDIAEAAGGELADAVAAEDSTPNHVATTLMRELRDAGRTVLVLEDVHWADEATLDVLGIVGSRVRTIPALVIATYRDNELDRTHPLRLVLGGLATRDAVTRIELSPLSVEAVGVLARASGIDPRDLHRATGGNPFFVTEVLATGDDQIPATVRDAVHARVARLAPGARDLLDAAAVLPPPVELSLLEAVADGAIEHVGECLAAGLLTDEARRLSFRHELARIAIENALPPDQRAALHRRALTALAAEPAPDLARLAHHAEASGDAAAVREFAPAAARRAASVGAHREAAAQYERALRFGEGLPPAARADLLDGCAEQCRLIGEFRRAIDLGRQAAQEHKRIGNTRRQAASLCAVAVLIWVIASSAEAHEVVMEAIAALGSDSDAPELLPAYDVLAGMCSGQHDREGVLEWAQRASDLAKRIGQPVPFQAQQYAALMVFARGGPPDELEALVEAAAVAGDENGAGLGYGLLALGAVRSRRHELAQRYIDAGLEYCTERDLTGHTPFVQVWQAVLELQQGRWAEAEASAEVVLREHGLGPATATTLTAVARLLIRRGDAGKDRALDETRVHAERKGDLWLLAPAAMATAEAAWLDGRPETVAGATDEAFAALIDAGETWVGGELASWRRRAGIHDDIPDWFPEPYALELTGNPLAAAAIWDELDCPYEAALARADSDDEAALRLALDQLRELGAEPAAAIVARRLRSRGAKGLPRGPRPATRDNPANLTSREVEVLALVAEGLRNGEIAQRLFLSEKTVSHHVSAILRKLDVRTRGEAGAAAVRLGLTGKDA